MAAPFVFVPEASQAEPFHPFYSTPPSRSPFLPPTPLIYPSSPFSPPGTPENFNANSVLWPESATDYESPYTASWAPLSSRQRTTSWHGTPPAPLSSPFLSPAPLPPFLHAQSAPFTPRRRRSLSWGASGAPPPPSWANSANPYLPTVAHTPLQIHPFLNGDAPSPVFHFDLAPVEFTPIRLIHPNPPQTAGLGAAEIRELAFAPPLTTLRILHPRIPFWPVDLKLPEEAAGEIPISLGDVLVSVHRAMHERISQADWETLSEEDREEVAKAFTKRCRAEAVRSGVIPAHLRDKEMAERNEGVKRVDFLLGKSVFKGLVRSPEDPDGVVRLVTA
ncbi:hypothetical protein R3P38DRAFT_2684571 [Favolaschia claudopus]|uniref:DUF6699 domain-containing protein n=1 Tax=Favolaschia claudopus TaxID=2862362 RepID=A0AAW0DJ04_9AGAR